MCNKPGLEEVWAQRKKDLIEKYLKTHPNTSEEFCNESLIPVDETLSNKQFHNLYTSIAGPGFNESLLAGYPHNTDTVSLSEHVLTEYRFLVNAEGLTNRQTYEHMVLDKYLNRKNPRRSQAARPIRIFSRMMRERAFSMRTHSIGDESSERNMNSGPMRINSFKPKNNDKYLPPQEKK